MNTSVAQATSRASRSSGMLRAIALPDITDRPGQSRAADRDDRGLPSSPTAARPYSAVVSESAFQVVRGIGLTRPSRSRCCSSASRRMPASGRVWSVNGGLWWLSLPVRLTAVAVIGASAESIVLFEIVFGFLNLLEHGDIDVPVRTSASSDAPS